MIKYRIDVIKVVLLDSSTNFGLFNVIITENLYWFYLILSR